MPRARPPASAKQIAPEDQWYRALDDNEQFQELLEHVGAVVTETDPDGRISYLTRTVEQLSGLPREHWLGREQSFEVHPDDYREIARMRGEPIEQVGREPIYHRSRHKDGQWHWIETIGSTRFVGPGGGVYGVSISRDVTALRRMQEELRETADRYSRVVQANDLILIESDPSGEIIYASENCERVLGFTAEEIMAQAPFERVHPDDLDRLRAQFESAVETGKPSALDVFRVFHRDGRMLWMQSTGVGYRHASGGQRFLNVTRDITDRVEAAKQRAELARRTRRAERLESLGLMAGGVAHDFNNLLTPILADASLLLGELDDASPQRRHLERIRTAAERAAELTHQMMAYAGADEMEPESVALSEFVDDVYRLLEATLPGGSSLHLDLPRGLPRIDADRGQLTQVVMNLITNAAEACDAGPGTIELRTGEAWFEEPVASPFQEAPLPAGRYAFVEVADDGCGMEAQTRERIFDPFFTTKFTGRGLGLASVVGIVRAHAGTIDVETHPGRGTRIRVWFPAGGEAEDDAPAAGRGAGASAGSRRRTVLVIDDDEGAREVAEESLVRDGFEVLAAADGVEGVAIFSERKDDVDLVVLDRTMPRLSGEETFDRLQACRRDVRVLLMSGYGEKRASEAFGGRRVAGFLKKPFVPEELCARIRELLADGSG